MTNQSRFAISLLVGGLLLAACSQAATPSSPPELPPNQGVTGSPLAPDFELTFYQGQEIVGGETILLSELLGQGRPIVLNFWAGLCPPCRAEMPDLQSVHEEYEGRILLVGLDVGPFTALGTREDGQALLEELEVTYPAASTFDGGILQDYQLFGMPSTYFITPDGRLLESWTGILTRDQLVEKVELLLAASG